MPSFRLAYRSKLDKYDKNQNGPAGLDRNFSYRMSMLNFLLSKATAKIYGAEKLTMHQWKVMSVLYIHAPIPASEIEPWVTLDKAAISRALQQLRKLGYIARQLRDNDARTVDVDLTQSGRQTYTRMAKQMARLQSELFRGLDSVSIELMFVMFNRLEQKLRERLAPSQLR